MSESEQDQPRCGHLRVSYRTKEEMADIPATEDHPGGRRYVKRGWWECDSGCGSKFWPIALGDHVAKRDKSLHGQEGAGMTYACPCGSRTAFISVWLLHTATCPVWAFRTDPETARRVFARAEDKP